MIKGKAKEILVSDGLSLENLLPEGEGLAQQMFAELCSWVSVGCTKGAQTSTVFPSVSFSLFSIPHPLLCRRSQLGFSPI